MKGGVELLAFLGSLMGLIAILERFMHYIPPELLDYIKLKASKLMSWATWQTVIVIDENTGHNTNEIYNLAELYVSCLLSEDRRNSAERIYFSHVKNASKPSYKPGPGETVTDTFEGVTFHWQFNETHPDSRSTEFRFSRSDGIRRKYTVTVDKRYKYTLLPRYMKHVVMDGKKLERESRDRFLYTNVQSWELPYSYPYNPWKKVTFRHASTFKSLALAPALKEKIMSDLDSFMSGGEFYHRVGRAWKRGYLLFGPPGTGKSSLVAAIANYTKYDVYDLELTEVKSNANLRELLIWISNKAIVVIEDIDCSLELKRRGKPAPETAEGDGVETKKPGGSKAEEDEKNRVTLSGLLNFIDGLWSCIESERIIIFTTNHKELLDPALLRSGRMDTHIRMSYCCFEAFRTLAWTYLKVKEHDMFQQVEKLIGEVEITPADVAEILIQNRGDADIAMERVVQALAEPERKKKSDPAKEDSSLDPELTVPLIS